MRVQRVPCRADLLLRARQKFGTDAPLQVAGRILTIYAGAFCYGDNRPVRHGDGIAAKAGAQGVDVPIWRFAEPLEAADQIGSNGLRVAIAKTRTGRTRSRPHVNAVICGHGGLRCAHCGRRAAAQAATE